jgi:tRNA G18 (ribose-2'-O)-methylase SpoU
VIEAVHDPADARLEGYRDLRDPGLRARDGLFVAESPRVVRRLLEGGHFRVRSVLATEPVIAALRDVLARTACPVYAAPRALVGAVVGFPFHRGCLALAERGEPREGEALLGPPGSRRLCVVEEVADPDNVGALFRCARAFGVDAVLLSPGAADPLYRKAIRVSLGATLLVPFARLAPWPAALARLRGAGYRVLALTPEGGHDLVDVARGPERVALLVGSEGRGLSEGARAAADLGVRIAAVPGAESLNVATAAAIALHHLLASRR